MQSQKVFGIGLSRTGTMAFHKTATNMGFRSRHYAVELFVHSNSVLGIGRPPSIPRGPIGRRRFSRRVEFWTADVAERNLSLYDVICDLPLPLYVEQLVTKFPEAVFVYTTRSMDSWLDSMEWMFGHGRIIWKFNELDYEILNAVYGCTRFNRTTLEYRKRVYEEKITQIFEGKEERLRTIDIDLTPITAGLLGNILNIDSGDAVPDQSVHRINTRKTASTAQRIDYEANRWLPFYPRAKVAAKKLFR